MRSNNLVEVDAEQLKERNISSKKKAVTPTTLQQTREPHRLNTIQDMTSPV